jgi:ATP-dependent Zn protease
VNDLERRRRAVHEAGHCVVAFMLDYVVEHVDIIDSVYDGVRLGGTERDRPPTVRCRHAILDELAVLAAGSLADVLAVAR